MQPKSEKSLMHNREPAEPVVPCGEHGAWLAMSLAVPVIALLLVVVDGERIAFRFLPRQTFPEVCWSRSFFGILCPLCGMTRSVVYLCHGDWQASLAMHRLGGMILSAVVIQIPVLAWDWRRQRLGDCSGNCLRGLRWVWAILFFMVVGNWIFDAIIPI